jgi:hypothetical protein
MYDYLLGGTDNFRADREACRALLEKAPNTRELALIHRAFLRRAVRFLAEAGLRQFIDHGFGLPAQDNVHQMAQRIAPASRVVYVDNDPLVVAQGRLILETNSRTTVIKADMRHTADILARPEVTRLIHRDEPTAVLFVSVLHCIKDEDDPWGLLSWFAENLPDGSFLVACQLTSDDPRVREDLTRFMNETTGGAWGRVRSRDEVRRFFGSPRMRVVDEVCEVSQWRPDSQVTPKMSPLEWEEFGGVAEIV